MKFIKITLTVARYSPAHHLMLCFSNIGLFGSTMILRLQGLPTVTPLVDYPILLENLYKAGPNKIRKVFTTVVPS